MAMSCLRHLLLQQYRLWTTPIKTQPKEIKMSIWSWLSKGATAGMPQAAAIEGASGLLGAALGAFSDPYKKEYKWWKKKQEKRIGDVGTYMKPKDEWVNIAGNLAAMNANMNNQVNRGLNMYRGGLSGAN